MHGIVGFLRILEENDDEFAIRKKLTGKTLYKK